MVVDVLDNKKNIPSGSLLALPLAVVPFASHLKCLNLEPVTLGAAGLWPSLALPPDLPIDKTMKKLATALLPKCHQFMSNVKTVNHELLLVNSTLHINSEFVVVQGRVTWPCDENGIYIYIYSYMG